MCYFIFCIVVVCFAYLQTPFLGVQATAVEKIEWVSKNEVNFTLLEPAGRENPVLGDIYVARGLHMSAMVPGKVIGRSETAVIAFNKTEIITTEFDLLVYPQASVSWVPYTYRDDPPTAILVYGGIDPVTMETLFPCRAWHNETFLVTGAYKLTKRRCDYPLEGTVVEALNFEILTVNAYGVLIKAGRGNPTECPE